MKSMPELQAELAFHAIPTPAILLLPDQDYTIVQVNDAYLKSSYRKREDLIGRKLFEIFPGGNQSAVEGMERLKVSFSQVVLCKQPDYMPVYRYDIPGLIEGEFEERYWRPTNIPIISKEGDVIYLLHYVEDVTTEMRLEDTNRRSETKYQSLFEHHPDAVFSLDTEGNFTSVNKKTIELAECSEAELLRMHFSEMCLMKDAALLDATFRKCLMGEATALRVSACSVKGTRRELSITILPLMVGPRAQGIYGIAKDISSEVKRRRERDLISRIAGTFAMGEALKDCLQEVLRDLCFYSETRLAEAWITSVDGNSLNRLAQVGLNRDPFYEKDTTFYEQKGLIGEAWKTRELVVKQNLQTNPEFLRKSFAKANQLNSGIAVPIVFNNQVIAVLGFYTSGQSVDTAWATPDLLDHLAIHIKRKKADHELAQYFNMSVDMLSIIGVDGYFKKVNPAFSRVLGYTEAELLSTPYIEFIHPDDIPISMQELGGIGEQESSKIFINRYITKNGDVVWMSWTGKYLEEEKLLFAVARDITEKKELEQAIENEQQRFAQMFAEAPVSMCILKGKNHVYENINEAFIKFTGRADVIGKPVIEAFPEVATQQIPQWLDHVFESGETFTFNEAPIELDIHGSGILQMRYLTFMYQPYRNSGGNVEGVFFFGIDVTEQVLSRKQIQESEKRYRDLIENLPVAVYTTDTSGKITLYNKALWALCGHELLIGETLWDRSLQFFNPDGTPLSFHQAPLMKTLQEGKLAWEQELILQKPDGTRRNIVAYPSPIMDAEGHLTGGVNVLIDLTERKQAEEELLKLSWIAEKTDNAVIVSHVDGTIEWVNDAFCQMTEYRPDEVFGRKKGEILDGEVTDHALRKVITQKPLHECFQYEIVNYTKSGKPFWVEVRHQPLLDANGRVIKFLDIATDITERKEAHEKLVKSEQEVRNFARQLNSVLEDERARIAREIHDEFGQQLAGLKLFILSLDSYLIEEGKPVLQTMLKNTDVIIQTLRRFATELRPGILDTLGLVPSIEWIVKDFEKKTGIPCSLKLEHEQQLTIDKDLSICCFRICQEALTNIIKHAEATFVYIELDVTDIRLFLRISDNGKGILVDRLNDPFSMGLLGMRERAHLSGGKLFINSLPNNGTTVELVVQLNNAN